MVGCRDSGFSERGVLGQKLSPHSDGTQFPYLPLITYLSTTFPIPYFPFLSPFPSFPLLPSIPLSLPLPSPSRGPTPLVQLGGLGEQRFSSPSGSGRGPAVKRFVVHYELKGHFW